LRDIAWFTPAGAEMSEQDWEAGFGRSIVVFLNGDAIPDLDARGQRVHDDSFLLCFNAHDGDITMTLPDDTYGDEWTIVLDTHTGTAGIPTGVFNAGAEVTVPQRSLLVLRRTSS
ncbi:glycogen debranching enzyme, partial [Kibdelosporangium lantanae]